MSDKTTVASARATVRPRRALVSVAGIVETFFEDAEPERMELKPEIDGEQHDHRQ